MKALILAGGAGTRLRPITHTRAKQLVPVANTPILHYGIHSMVAAGITELGVIVGDTREEVMADLGDGSRFGASVTYIPQDEPLGLAHCVLIARDFLGDDDFVMYLGDNLLEQDLEAFVGAFAAARDGEHPPSAQILLKPVSDPQRFGIASLDDDGHVVHLVEKPTEPPSNLALVGVYLFDSEIHEAVAAIAPSERGELEITDAIQWLIDQGRRVRTEILTGWWIDTGKLTPLLEANRLILETIEPRIDGTVDDESFIDGRVVIEAGAEVINSTIRGPVAIGANTQVVDSFIGPFSAIGADCEVRHSEIEHSVVMERSQVIDIPRLEDSLIGSDAVVSRSKRKPRAVRLMVGDHCQIDIE
ncbi:MAG: glucose-1-phosphate thymidylyltransferase [Ilumatobacteraceae bacterium]|nr:glucose-1-phosphate thymidylyltransferase [Ilumatobacteraceae bacterium]